MSVGQVFMGVGSALRVGDVRGRLTQLQSSYRREKMDTTSSSVSAAVEPAMCLLCNPRVGGVDVIDPIDPIDRNALIYQTVI